MKILIFTITLLLLFYTQSFANYNLTLICSKNQYNEVKELISELDEFEVNIRHVLPENISSSIKDNNIIIITTEKEQSFHFIKDKLPKSVQDNISKDGYGKYVLLRDIWSTGQEVVVIVGHDEKTVSLVRNKTESSWWPTVTNWFGISVQIVKPY